MTGCPNHDDDGDGTYACIQGLCQAYQQARVTEHQEVWVYIKHLREVKLFPHIFINNSNNNNK